MKPPIPSLRRTITFATIAVLVGALLVVAPMGVLSQEGSVETPTPQDDGDFDCSQFDSREQVEVVFDPADDEYRLDRDGDDVACEGIGDSAEDASTATPTATATATATDEPTATAAETATPTTEQQTGVPTETETTTPTTTATETGTDTSEETGTSAVTKTAETTETDEQSGTSAATGDTAVDETQNDTDAEPVFYQVDFVVGEPIENLRGPEGTYANDHLIRFVHGSTEEPVMRRAPGAFAYAESNLTERIESHEITVENGTATVTFTVDEGEALTLSLASYEKPGPGWSPATEAKQEFVDSESRTFESGTHTLTVDLPAGDEANDSQTANGEGELSVAGLSADADGTDNNNLNDEFITYENTGNATLNLSGWTVTDSAGTTYIFPAGFTLAPGEQVTLYTGSGTDTDSELYWGQASEVWNNGADSMTVRNDEGEVVLQRSYPA